MSIPNSEDKRSDDESDDVRLYLLKDKRPSHRPQTSSASQTTSPDPSTNEIDQVTIDSCTAVDDSSSMSMILSSPIMTAPNSSVYWNPDDLLQAARLLTIPTEPTPVSLLTDSEQMRRVFTLIYDVLRYKSVLDEALQTVKFYRKYPEMKEKKSLIWLLFYDLFKRDFQPRSSPLNEIVDGCKLSQTDSLLWENRVKLGATLSKMRIKNKAYDLENLLPVHLQNSRTSIDDSVISGWINFFKTTPEDVFSMLDEVGFSHLPHDRDNLSSLTYKLDHLLPRYIHCRPNSREEFVNTSLFQDNSVIMQERTFCLGPAIVAQIVSELTLAGNVVQTHVSCLPTVAYLANLLATNENIDELLVFGAGDGKEQCETYLKGLGVTNTRVFSENFTQLSHDPSNLLENVVGVLATPPNTNSNVFDPVDLAVARGGDLSILEQLTSDTLHDASGSGQVMGEVLNEQRDTLRVAMSKPQIQFVVYETHSRYELENSNMVVRVITEMNGYATEKHIEEQRRSHTSADESGQQQLDADDTSAGPVATVSSAAGQQSQTQREQSVEAEEMPVTKSPSVTVPPCDLFELAALPDLCPQLDECLNAGEHGTFIAVIKRKEITRLDPKYMIQMAESRGLFGRKGDSGRSRYASREMRKKAAMKLQRSHSGSDSDRKEKTKIKIEIDRIAAPTHSSSLRDKRKLITSVEEILCKRHVHHLSSLDGSTNEEIIECFTVPKSKRLKSMREQNLVARRLSYGHKFLNKDMHFNRRNKVIVHETLKMPHIEHDASWISGLGVLRKLSKIIEDEGEEKTEHSKPIDTDSLYSCEKYVEFTNYNIEETADENLRKR